LNGVIAPITHRHAPLAGGRGVDGDHFPSQLAGRLGGRDERLHAALGLAPRFLHRLPGFARQQPCEFFDVAPNQRRDALEQLGALAVGEPAHRARGGLGRADRLGHGIGVGLVNPSGRSPVIGHGNGLQVAGGHPFTADIHGISFCHAVTST
jgi:hypothetical protein